MAYASISSIPACEILVCIAKNQILVFTAKYQYLLHTCISSNIYISIISLKIAKWNELKWDSMTLCWPSGRDTVPIHLRKLRRKGSTLWAIGIASQRSPLTNTPRGKSQIVIIPLLVYVPLKNIYKFIQSLLGGIIKFYGGIFPARYRQRAIYSKTASS